MRTNKYHTPQLPNSAHDGPEPEGSRSRAGNHTGPAAMNESKEEGCTGIAVGLLQVSCFDHRRCLRSIYGLHFTRLRRQAGLSLTTIIVERACSLSARDSSSTGEIRVKTSDSTKVETGHPGWWVGVWKALILPPETGLVKRPRSANCGSN